MKQFEVDVDITMSKRIYVDAENEDEAREKVEQRMKENPYEYAHSFDAYVKHEITDVNEEETGEKTEIQKAVEYIRNHMDEDDMAILKAEMNKCYKMHLIPNEGVMDCSQVIDLLEEYGEENELPEGWWQEECDLDEILCEL